MLVRMLVLGVALFPCIMYSKSLSVTVTTGSGLNIREEPSVKSKIVVVAKKNETLDVQEAPCLPEVIESEVGVWLKVNYHGKNGYAFSSYTNYMDLVSHKLIGRYATKDRYPSEIQFVGPQTFKMNANLCNDFGDIAGKWVLFYDAKTNNELIYLKILSSSFNLRKEDYISVILNIVSHDVLTMKQQVTGSGLGCEFYPGETFYRVSK